MYLTIMIVKINYRPSYKLQYMGPQVLLGWSADPLDTKLQACLGTTCDDKRVSVTVHQAQTHN